MSFLPSLFKRRSSGKKADSSPDLNSRPDSPTEIGQFASRVVNFSSQYGTAGTSSYAACNLAGDRRIVDKYGDFIEAFVLRTYGPWWQRCPSAAPKLSKAAANFQSEDFVELEYEVAVVPSRIIIYETYHPGSVVRILASNGEPNTEESMALSFSNSGGKEEAVDGGAGSPEIADTPGKVEWVTIWSGKPQCSQIPKAVRHFSPELKKISFPTRLIRLEFNSVDCDYYTELDAVELFGFEPSRDDGPLKDRAEGFQLSLTTRLLRQLSLTDRQTSVTSQEDEDYDKWGYFALLPDEVIQQIMSFLDVISLSYLAQTCSLLLKNAYDPLLCSELDLQSRWNTVDDVALESVVSRCSNLQHLNLSWTGGGGQITEQAVCSFLEECGRELKTLRLACCQYVHEKTVQTIARVCEGLEELDLQSCMQLKRNELVHIEKLRNLKRLNLYSVRVSDSLLATIGKCSKLEHLNLGASVMGVTNAVEQLVEALSQCLSKLKNLISLDLWRCRFATHATMTVIANNCPRLQELDIGWSTALRPHFQFQVETLCSKCKMLKKLFLTSGRSVDDDDLLALAKHCPDLEQLDILGTNKVTKIGAEAVCNKCPKLSFFDISFCGSLKDEVVAELRSVYSHVNFKKSFQ